MLHELCSDAACGDEFCKGGGADNDGGSPGVYKVRLVVSPMMTPGVDVDMVSNPSNDLESTGDTYLPHPLPHILDSRPAPRPIFA